MYYGRFESGDLLYALHDATMFVNAKKDNQNKWNFEIELNDTYDFTDFKNLEEYIQLLPYLPDDKFLKLFKEFHLNHGFINKNKVIEVCNQRFYKALDEEYEKRFL